MTNEVLKPPEHDSTLTGMLGVASAAGHGETYSGDGALLSLLQRTTFIGELLRNVLPKLPVKLRAADLPTASAAWRYAMGVVSEPGQPDDAVICLLTVASPETYEWVSFGLPEALPATTDLKDVLVQAGFVLDGGATPLNLDGGDLTVDDISADAITAASAAFSGNVTVTQDVTLRNLAHTGTLLGFYNHTPVTRRTIFGSVSGATANVLDDVLQALEDYGIIIDSTTA